MNLWQEYRQPTSLSEAIEDLKNAPSPAVPVAGGTDILLDMRQGRHAPAKTLIDLTEIPEMKTIELIDGELFIGAAVPVNRIIQNELVVNNAQALVEACDLIAGPQVRNTATLGGNVAHALPAADGTIAMVALDAVAEIASSDGRRRIPFVDLFAGPGKSTLDKGAELIAGFYISEKELGQASCFKRIMRPQGVALPILNCAVWVQREDNLIADIHIAVGPGGPTPFRATEAEAVLRGKELTEDIFETASTTLVSQAKFRTSPRRATADYRKYIVLGLFRETFDTAWQRAANEHDEL